MTTKPVRFWHPTDFSRPVVTLPAGQLVEHAPEGMINCVKVLLGDFAGWVSGSVAVEKKPKYTSLSVVRDLSPLESLAYAADAPIEEKKGLLLEEPT